MIFTSPQRARLKAAGLMMILLAASSSTLATQVRFTTPVGSFDVQLLDDVAPNTVANFLQYVESGAYQNSFVHRKEAGFVVQGGGFTFTEEDGLGLVTTNSPVANEFNRSNQRGTIAMARLGGQPDSATSQWYINLRDNSNPLDTTDGGYTVFGEVMGDGMEVVDLIGSIQNWSFANVSSALGNWPLKIFGGRQGESVTQDHILFTDIRVIDEDAPFEINPGLNGSWRDRVTRGQGFFLDIFPDTGLASLGWYTYDTELPDEDVQFLVGDPGNRWMTAVGELTGGDTVTLTVYAIGGGTFDQPHPVDPLPNVAVGTMVMSFEDCNRGRIDYDLTAYGLSGSTNIERIVADNVPLCEELAAAAAEAAASE